MSNGGPAIEGQRFAPSFSQVSAAASSAQRQRKSDDRDQEAETEKVSEQVVSREAFTTGTKLDISA
jgi:hypothetical protein